MQAERIVLVLYLITLALNGKTSQQSLHFGSIQLHALTFVEHHASVAERQIPFRHIAGAIASRGNGTIPDPETGNRFQTRQGVPERTLAPKARTKAATRVAIYPRLRLNGAFKTC